MIGDITHAVITGWRAFHIVGTGCQGRWGVHVHLRELCTHARCNNVSRKVSTKVAFVNRKVATKALRWSSHVAVKQSKFCCCSAQAHMVSQATTQMQQ